LAAAKIDLCVLANNHVLDWGYEGLVETLDVLERAKTLSVGAGRDRKEAQTSVALPVKGKGRVIVFAFGFASSGIPDDWVATDDRPGVNLLSDLSQETILEISAKVKEVKRPGDIAIASIHWGTNWGYAIPAHQTGFAHRLIDQSGIDVIHGHSSHHAKGIEVYRGKPIIYGCGDFINDYEGISGYEEFRADLGLMYFVTMDPRDGRLVRLEMTPTRIRNFRVNRASKPEAIWLRDTLNREGQRLGTRVSWSEDNRLTLEWG
jgi:poly-gamma-glutamate capsule biosynthesis protein CapA/YwtB (metallophosphatase superfamily)